MRGDQFVQCGDAFDAFGQPPGGEPLAGLVHELDIVVVFGPVVADVQGHRASLSCASCCLLRPAGLVLRRPNGTVLAGTTPQQCCGQPGRTSRGTVSPWRSEGLGGPQCSPAGGSRTSLPDTPGCWSNPIRGPEHPRNGSFAEVSIAPRGNRTALAGRAAARRPLTPALSREGLGSQRALRRPGPARATRRAAAGRSARVRRRSRGCARSRPRHARSQSVRAGCSAWPCSAPLCGSPSGPRPG